MDREYRSYRGRSRSREREREYRRRDIGRDSPRTTDAARRPSRSPPPYQDRQPDRARSRSPRRTHHSPRQRHSESRSRSRLRDDLRDGHDRRERRKGRSGSRPLSSHSRSRSPDSRRKERSQRKRSRSSSGSSSSSDDRKHKRRKEKHKRKRSKSRDRERKERKKEKREKKKKKTAAASHHWGKYGIINETDLYNKEQEFRAWLVEERKINPETITKDQTKKEFARFVEDYNTATLPHEKFYHMEAYERRMNALRAGEFVPPPDDSYDPMADLRAHESSHKRRPVEKETYMNKEQLQELRRVQNERIEAGRMKLLGMDIKQNMGVRMDGSVFE
ncbi:hypothetical protein CERSUDRAFT_108497 [Gelatoporia subvermispora B]|uniref:Uncharacterized protein n=1 Tax=Ceriporiopsis subvermispora (strain B) TaxID=914234 RepID=M2R459_CERS8|nr:hypothetical protein CERSUDRAFT_108497 [Gelatoporia subvermispora B]